ncbi:3-methyl-2-oxobutanoate hydroxymethyltransferase [Pseudomonas bharatica]|uniref:3-methyl-2-oxobutanoate hydroxymethyltransferase n=1 Tax=Pseudomonas bharatica TaxID=2692112 RepID=UPI003B28017E
MHEQHPPYSPEARELRPSRIRIPYLQKLKQQGRKWVMLTSYDMYTAAIFEEAGIPVLLVGDSASNNVFGNQTTLDVTVDELLPLVRAVSKSTQSALVIADLPFGSYQASPEQCFQTAVRFFKEAGAHAVKLEGGLEMVPQVEKLTRSGIPVMAHIGFTPQMEHQLGGYRVQGRGADAKRLIAEAKALETAGAFAILMEMIPEEVGRLITESVKVPTVGIGAGRHCDAQVLVWQDMAGLRSGQLPRFAKQYCDIRSMLLQAAQAFAQEVDNHDFPTMGHSF